MLGSMVAGSLEEIIDKVIIIKKAQSIDGLIATFYRNLCFYFFTIILGLTGLFGSMTFVINVHFLIIAIMWPLNSLSYDYFLRHVEISRFNAFFYLFPFIFLIIDATYFHVPFAAMKIIGILFLVLGAFLFSVDLKRGKSVITVRGFFWLLIKMLSYIYLLFVFKLMSNSVNEVSFYFSIWTIVIFIYLIFLVSTQRYRSLVQTASINGFLYKTFLSKGFDTLSSIFYLEALSFTSLTLISAFASFSPIVLLILLLGLTKFSRINVAEDFSKIPLTLKIIGTLFLILGGLFMFISK